MEENKHTYTQSNKLYLSCYHCNNQWEEEGVLHTYRCDKCGKEAEGNPQL